MAGECRIEVGPKRVRRLTKKLGLERLLGRPLLPGRPGRPRKAEEKPYGVPIPFGPWIAPWRKRKQGLRG